MPRRGLPRCRRLFRKGHVAGARDLCWQNAEEQVEGVGNKGKGKTAGREHCLEPADVVGDQVLILNQGGRGDDMQGGRQVLTRCAHRRVTVAKPRPQDNGGLGCLFNKRLVVAPQNTHLGDGVLGTGRPARAVPVPACPGQTS